MYRSSNGGNATAAPKLQRTEGEGRVSFKLQHDASGDVTRLDRLYQRGAAKVRLPKVYDGRAEAVLINTSGGLTGGDTMRWQVLAAPKTSVVVTTQACEKLYKSSGGNARVDTSLEVGEGAELHWLPQETILFDRARLERRFTVNLDNDARFLAVEPVIFGRETMGEEVHAGLFKDRWRIYRNGHLIHADDLCFSGSIHSNAKRKAVLAGARAFATILYSGPEDDEQLRAKLCSLLPDQDELSWGVSVWNGKLAARFSAESGFALRAKLIPFLGGLRDPFVLPKLWKL
ncbi:urease accessory protein UreD [Rhodobacteraceae bacterium RKSG542]|uniref:urease accessory protein UreD n=1 Tax=Pseudovibrio flavus TaxID=2529854 RepID=UPI0012BBC20E|nr:urease accessory protein UreD [Pseudovibrio flavus]MTI17937.1 urease accessory protein UreD [Pseudovibrio flavus]